ncbi:MAG: methyltransferase domain-containing protein [Pseudomonadota bacterium]
METQNNVAELYSNVSAIQRARGLDLIHEVQPKPGDTVLDLGCGTGDLTVELARLVGPSGHVFAIDPDVDRLAVAREQNPGEFNNITYIEGRGEDLSMIEPQSIDLLFSNYVIHWMADKYVLMRGLQHCMKPGGTIACEISSELTPFLDTVSKMDAHCERVFLPQMIPFHEHQFRDALTQNAFWVKKGETKDIFAHFDSADAFFDWWHATTHGMFNPDVIDENDRRTIQAQFENGGDVHVSKAVRVIANRLH